MVTVTCSICTTTEDVPPVEGRQPDMPSGWGHVTIAERGRHVRNFQLCRRCTTSVRSHLSRLGEQHRDSLPTTRP